MEDKERLEAVRWEVDRLMANDKELRLVGREYDYATADRIRELRQRLDELTGFAKDKA